MSKISSFIVKKPENITTMYAGVRYSLVVAKKNIS